MTSVRQPQKKIILAKETLLSLFGPGFNRKKRVEELLDIQIRIRGNEVVLVADSPDQLKNGITRFLKRIKSPAPLSAAVKPSRITLQLEPEPEEDFHRIAVTAGRRANVFTKTAGQTRFFRAIQENDLVFAVGPAGTGKTYLAVAMAVEALRTKRVERIILVRPAVEAGENLGFLPGNLREKVEPYLTPLYDALYDILPQENVRSYFENRAIEVSPLAYMRGRTLNSAFIILDEAQNTTPPQMKMFLTRLGHGSKAIVAGDITQIDLSEGQSGLLSVPEVLGEVEGVAFVALDGGDVVRHRLVKRIVHAYERYERNHEQSV
ncbi:MAG: hypothetical protein A2293_02010 [Elusimicrobia bacterium RIFOXYB2_FULL_49_7]|nr:MAG: hypothetical protein A2293_02010 [Elusimicrobia bacterium RIFOXYB2_FULL_49_7]